MTKAELYMQQLHEEGYKARLDEDNDVLFKCEGTTLILTSDAEDASFFRLMLPCFRKMESGEEEERALRAVNVVNERMKVVKLFLVDGHVWAAIELFLDPFETFKNVLNRCVRLILCGANRFQNEMNA